MQRDDYSVTSVDHKFLLPGHTFLPNDQDFGLIEKNKRYHSDVFVPHDWVRVVATARKDKPFIVTELEQSDFVSTDELVKQCINRKMNASQQKVEWLKIQWMHFDRDHPNVMFFKYSVSPDAYFTSVDFTKKIRGRPKSINNIELSPLYPDGRPIPRLKLKDLKDLLKYIPAVNHQFYRELKCDNSADEDGGGGTGVWTESDTE